jgi:hypothetical protein
MQCWNINNFSGCIALIMQIYINEDQLKGWSNSKWPKAQRRRSDCLSQSQLRDAITGFRLTNRKTILIIDLSQSEATNGDSTLTMENNWVDNRSRKAIAKLITQKRETIWKASPLRIPAKADPFTQRRAMLAKIWNCDCFSTDRRTSKKLHPKTRAGTLLTTHFWGMFATKIKSMRSHRTLLKLRDSKVYMQRWKIRRPKIRELRRTIKSRPKIWIWTFKKMKSESTQRKVWGRKKHSNKQ